MANEALLDRLVTVYLGMTIQYPKLRAVTLAQWLLESGRGDSVLAKEHYNFGGLKWRPEMAPYSKRIRYEAHDGIEHYCKFPTLESFVRGYWAFINRSPYSGWEEHAQDEDEFMRFIGPTYCPNDGYVDKVLALLPDANTLLSGSHTIATRVATRESASIVIDPGHGGSQQLPGSSPNNAISASGVKEKALTLEFALMLEQELFALDRNLEITLTRREDRNLAGKQRAKSAQDADLFLSIHFNGHKGKARGTETFYGATANGNGQTITDMEFAQAINGAVYAAIAQLDPQAHDRGIKPDTETKLGKLAVLRRVHLGQRPRACLLEVEFIDHVAVDKLLVSGPNAVGNKATIARALAAVLVQHLGETRGA